MHALNHPPLYPEARFWNRIARRYAEKPVPDQTVYETKLAKTDSYLKPTDQVLEIGCGTGTTAIHHAPNVAHIRATDISHGMIEIARDKARAADVDNADFAVASIEDLQAEPQSFNVILAHSILHLVPGVDRVLVQLHAMLKPGGLLISTTTCIQDFMPAIRFIAPLGRKLGLMPYVNIFGAADMERWLTDAGFVVEHRWLPRPKSGIYVIARKADP